MYIKTSTKLRNKELDDFIFINTDAIIIVVVAAAAAKISD